MRDRQHERNSARSKKINLPLQTSRHRRKPNTVNTAAGAFNACFEQADVGLSITDLEGRLVQVNPGFCSLTGYTESELLQSFYLTTLVHPSDLLLEQEKIRALIAGEVPAFVVEQRYVKQSGAIVWVQNSVSLITDDAGRPAKIARFTQNVTARKLAEVSFREIEARNESLIKESEGALEATKTACDVAERQYQEIFENAGEGIFRSTPEGFYLTVNPALARMHGFDSPAELIRSRRDISREVYVQPIEREEFKRLLEEYGRVRDFEHQTFRKDGSKIWISVNAHAVRDDAGRILYYEGTAQDITERKRAEQALRESEERYRELFENSKDAFYVHDMNGVYISVNRAAEKLSGYRRHEIIGKHFSEFVSRECARQVQRQLQKKLEIAGETTYDIEMITKKGKHVPVEVSSRLIVEQGVAVGVQGCVRDISEKKKAQEAARNYSRRLIEAQEAERRRISRELHDQVGQILTAVKMNLHALQHTSNQPETLSSIADNLKVIDEAVDQVRDLSVDLRPLLLDDFGLVVALRWYLDRQTRNIGVPAKFVSGSLDEDDRFSSELETACFRIVQEGVTNIVRHARATRISIRLERVVSDLILLITDDGAGFDARLLRSGTAGTATLGLRGMEERAQAVGGTITIDSAPALGTEICARLP
ncbi:MAG TPA: PAS domain S-box protein, partial [Pyrinomonadaceae bacterium]|nr:PAS domain S-box protein [Pyrinomonadaceae bacterium]